MKLGCNILMCLILALATAHAHPRAVNEELRAEQLPEGQQEQGWWSWVKGGIRNGAMSAVRFTQGVAQTWFGSERVAGQEWPPAFCNDLVCPQYTVVESTPEYEVRQYVATQWVSTQKSGAEFEEASRQMFWPLFKYIKGANGNNQSIDMTAPVVTWISPMQDGSMSGMTNNFNMSFFITPEMTSPPSPRDARVYLQSHGAGTVYIRAFGGYASKEDIMQHAVTLKESLPATYEYYTSFYYVAQYDSPFRFLNRHNEIWFIGK